MQAFKPYAFSLQPVEVGGLTTLVPQQHKNAEVILTRAMCKSPETGEVDEILTKMYNTMQQRDIDVIHFKSTVKVGAHDVVNIKNIDTGTIQTIPYEDVGIQLSVTDHLTNSESSFGSQLRTLLFQIQDEELLREWVDLIGDNVSHESNEITKIVRNKEELRNQIEEFILQNTKNPDEILEYVQLVQDINGKLDFKIPLALPAINGHVARLLMSMYKNRVFKQEINGGKAVQVSSFAWNNDLKITEDGYLECYMTPPFQQIPAS